MEYEKVMASLAKIAHKIINNEIDLLDGVHQIVYLAQDLPEGVSKRLEEIISKLASIESQTDHIPGKKSEPVWDPSEFKKKQIEREEYINFFRNDIVASAKELAQIWASEDTRRNLS